MAFYPADRRGLVMGDPVDGKFRILATHGSGRSWAVVPDDGMPAARTDYGIAVGGESGEVRGTSISADGGRSWTRVGATGYHALDCTHDGSCWAPGGGGRVARLAR